MCELYNNPCRGKCYLCWMQIHLHVHYDERKLDLIISNQHKIMGTLADIQAQNTALIAAVADEDTVIDSAVVLISGFATTLADIQKQLADAIAGNDPTAIQAVADSMASTVADVNAKKTALANAVAAGTGTPTP